MNVLLSVSLWLALIMSSCCGHETEELTTDHTVTQTTDYEYNYIDTFDYSSFPEVQRMIPNKGSGIGQLNLVLNLLGLVILHAWN